MVFCIILLLLLLLFDYELFVSTYHSKIKHGWTLKKKLDLLPNEQAVLHKIKNNTICGGELKDILKNSKKRDSAENILKTTYWQWTWEGRLTFHPIPYFQKKKLVVQ